MRKQSLFLALVLAGCAPTTIAPPVQRGGTTIQASFGKTWNAVIDVFAERNIPIKTIDRSSGLVVTEQLPVALTAGVGDWADCGKDMMGGRQLATHGSYNVLVRGDSTSTVVKVTPRFVRIGPARQLFNHDNVAEECSSQGAWESDAERHIKDIAERGSAAQTPESMRKSDVEMIRNRAPGSSSCPAPTIKREGDDLVSTVSLMYRGKCETQPCRSKGGALTMSNADALAACLAEAKAGIGEP